MPKPHRKIMININNNPEIFELIKSSLEYMPLPWTISKNCSLNNQFWKEHCRNGIPKFFNLWLSPSRDFSWATTDTDISYLNNPKVVDLNTVAEASQFMDKVYEIELRLKKQQDDAEEDEWT